VLTSLPYPSFEKSAYCLDAHRLGIQRMEARQILHIINEGDSSKSRWKKHPAVNMWRGYEFALVEYMNVMITEWLQRGYENKMSILVIRNVVRYPAWLGDVRLHASHRSNLLRGNPSWYERWDWREKPDLPYWWPV